MRIAFHYAFALMQGHHPQEGHARAYTAALVVRPEPGKRTTRWVCCLFPSIALTAREPIGLQRYEFS